MALWIAHSVSAKDSAESEKWRRSIPKGCQKLAGGRSAAETPGIEDARRVHPGRVPEPVPVGQTAAPSRLLGTEKNRPMASSGIPSGCREDLWHKPGGLRCVTTLG